MTRIRCHIASGSTIYIYLTQLNLNDCFSLTAANDNMFRTSLSSVINIYYQLGIDGKGYRYIQLFLLHYVPLSKLSFPFYYLSTVLGTL